MPSTRTTMMNGLPPLSLSSVQLSGETDTEPHHLITLWCVLLITGGTGQGHGDSQVVVGILSSLLNQSCTDLLISQSLGSWVQHPVCWLSQVPHTQAFTQDHIPTVQCLSQSQRCLESESLSILPKHDLRNSSRLQYQKTFLVETRPTCHHVFHSFIQKIFILHLLWARHYARPWGHSGVLRHCLWPVWGQVLGEQT